VEKTGFAQYPQNISLACCSTPAHDCGVRIAVRQCSGYLETLNIPELNGDIDLRGFPSESIPPVAAGYENRSYIVASRGSGTKLMREIGLTRFEIRRRVSRQYYDLDAVLEL